jgi:hypothetical protein
MSNDTTTPDIMTIREMGLGNGFAVLDPADGYRKNNQLWFGTCATCGEGVTSSRHDNGIWMHRLVVEKGNPPHIGGRGDTTRQIDYCPMTEEGN